MGKKKSASGLTVNFSGDLKLPSNSHQSWAFKDYLSHCTGITEAFLHPPYILHFRGLNSHSDARQKLFIWHVARVEPSACVVQDVENETGPLPASSS